MAKKKQIDHVGIHSFSKKTDWIFSTLVGILSFSCILPFIFVIVISLTDEKSLNLHGYSFWPESLSWSGYEYLLTLKDEILQALFITVFITVVGTTVNVFFTSLYAYAISRNDFKYRRFFTMMALITMLFGAGTIPTYIIMTSFLNLKDTVAALILPMMLSPFNIMVMRTFFKKTIPDSLIESARIDGAGELKIFFKICLPLALPGIATISLFTALAFWNDWYNALLYIQSDNLVPLQYLLMKIQSNIDYLAQNAGAGANIASVAASVPREATRMAIVVVSTLPIACLYPFFQRYFVKGLTIGGVKE
ncbi:carbohydrate ABC transporter permease [Streptococcus hillyeri]|uniref:Carbohydrate ABC transporter permease n=1 Tax=Streptococcus hillyeri TaxID=2282420 RepID=A0A3L9DZE0_9STRE|nr:carbohydrate ABC transporter permease [Streptococcus hillyeri]RLY05343.1 carbohydrate ABC transporter permease [Streptococcus hillyeri]